MLILVAVPSYETVIEVTPEGVATVIAYEYVDLFVILVF